MFTPKANSKQKLVKKTQKHETGYAVRGALGKTPFFTQKPKFHLPKPQFRPKVRLHAF